MDEFAFIKQIKQATYKQSSLIKGVGDDAAIFRTHGSDVVTAVDTFVDGVHFTTHTSSFVQIGYKALSANISDMAAMGAEPKFYLVSIVIPPSLREGSLTEIYDGMKQIATKYHIDLIGGDTVSGEELVVSITIIGYVASNKARLRSDAKSDDIVFVTGTLGDSAAGLHLLTHNINENRENKQYFIHRHQMPSPRIEIALHLRHLNRVCLNDVTDGIANELREIAEASDVDIVIEDDLIPVHQNFYQFKKEQQDKWKLFGGEDFELVGTMSEDNWQELKQIAKQLKVNVTRIGHVKIKDSEDPKVFLKKHDTISDVPKDGYTHLK